MTHSQRAHAWYQAAYRRLAAAEVVGDYAALALRHGHLDIAAAWRQDADTLGWQYDARAKVATRYARIAGRTPRSGSQANPFGTVR